jgi:hypothetical protein
MRKKRHHGREPGTRAEPFQDLVGRTERQAEGQGVGWSLCGLRQGGR